MVDVGALGRVCVALGPSWGRLWAAGLPSAALILEGGVAASAHAGLGERSGATADRAAAELAVEVKKRGKWLHMGRVNSLRRLTVAQDMGCDSTDGSSLSMFGDKYIHTFCRWSKHLHEQPTLFV